MADIDLGVVQDIVTEWDRGYYETVYCNGTDILMNKNKYAIWNGLAGEIKTRIGECTGVGQERYGCDIWKIIGQPLIPAVVAQAEFYIKELIPKYDKITDITIASLSIPRKGTLKMSLSVSTTLGNIEGVIILV